MLIEINIFPQNHVSERQWGEIVDCGEKCGENCGEKCGEQCGEKCHHDGGSIPTPTDWKN